MTAIKPMLCHSAEFTAVPRVGWVMEPKFDGWRWQVVIDDQQRVRSYGGRVSTEYTGKTPGIEAALARLPRGTVLDGELLPREKGHQSTKVSTLLAHSPDDLIFVAFDVLRVLGDDVTRATWDERRAMLEVIAQAFDDRFLHIAPVFDIDEDLFDAWIEHGMEGAVCKAKNSVYRPDKRTRDWVKVKPQKTDDATIVGFDPGKGKYEGMVGALRLVMVDTGVTTTASGMTDAQRRDMTDHPERWLGRRIEIAHHGLHPETQVPRHPQFKRLREDLEVAS